MTNTEALPPKDKLIDHLSTKDSLNIMLINQYESFGVLQSNILKIANVVERIFKVLKKTDNGRLLYAGAGTSARIGVQDGVELFPTFGWPKERVGFVIAGGIDALTNSIENSEDDKLSAVNKIKKLNVGKHDVLIGIAASGNTPFTVSAIKKARESGALTVGIANNVNSKIEKNSEISIILNTGYEILAGSTRLKAGTTQKVCLNLISTMLMVKFGKVKNGMMVNMQPNNKKLMKRQKFIRENIT